MGYVSFIRSYPTILARGVKVKNILISRILDKTGVLGTIVSGLSCTMCFPALASIGAAVGLGFLSRWEGFFVHILIPVFLVIILLANSLGWFAHHQWQRSLLEDIGPVIALFGDQGMVQHFLPVEMARILLYAGLVFMVMIAIWDMVSPAHKRCPVPSEDNKSPC